MDEQYMDDKSVYVHFSRWVWFPNSCGRVRTDTVCGRCIQGEDARSLQTCKSRNVRGVNFFSSNRALWEGCVRHWGCWWSSIGPSRWSLNVPSSIFLITRSSVFHFLASLPMLHYCIASSYSSALIQLNCGLWVTSVWVSLNCCCRWVKHVFSVALK